MRTSAVIRTFIVFAGLGLIATGIAPSTASAQTASLSVSTSVANKCLISTSSVAFAAYDPVVAHATSNDDGTGSVTVRCTKGATASVTLGDGANTSRNLKNENNVLLDYELYTNEGRSAVWTSVNLGQSASAATPLVATVFGRIPGGQDVPSGSYNDTVVATVNF
jgi:spore coat protein U-like protein